MESKRDLYFLNKHNTKSNEFKLHKHNCFEIIYVLSGSGTVVIGDQTHSVTENMYYVVSPQTYHTEQFEGYGEIFFIGFTHGNKDLIPKNGVYRVIDMSMPLYFKKIIDEYKQQSAEYEIAAAAILDLLLVTAIRNVGGTGKKCKDLEYIKTYIEQYYSQKINFGQLARLSGYSYDYFRHIFKERFNTSPQEYLINIRLENASRLLEGQTLSCTEIAYTCGFSTCAQMSSLFKRKFGVSPSAYKKAD
jgi:AraC family transcriptional activator of pobA